MTVFLHYTQEEIDRQFNQVTLVPHYEEYFANDAKLSAEFRKTHPGHLDIAYGPHPDERLDIFPPPNPTNAPLFLYFHGGGWKYQSKDDVSYIGEHFISRGAFHIPINYTLAPPLPYHVSTTKSPALLPGSAPTSPPTAAIPPKST